VVAAQYQTEAGVGWIKSSNSGIFITLVVLVTFFYLSNPIFLSPVNVAAMLRAMSYTGIVAVGLALCLISGIIDLSVGSTAALTSVVFGAAMKFYNVDMIPAILITMGIGVCVGLVNSFVILKLKVSPFIATISMMFVIRGVANWVSNGYSIYPLPSPVMEIGAARPLGISWAFFAFVVIAITAELFMRFSLTGFLFRAVGSDREVAYCTEVDVDKINTMALVITGFLGAIAGVFISFMTNSGTPSIGQGWEFIAITACAIGGVSLFGYHGSIFGLFCGLAVIQVVNNGIVMLGINPYLQSVVVGALLLGAIYLDIQRRTYLDLETI
jgi:ribose transport system permease protein